VSPTAALSAMRLLRRLAAPDRLIDVADLAMHSFGAPVEPLTLNKPLRH